jgi:uncharacterized protein (DUF934 family)
MTIIVRDDGFNVEGFNGVFTDWQKISEGETFKKGSAIDIPNTLRGDELTHLFDETPMFRIPFPSSADGRGFSIARLMRLLGYTGTLRASGALLADQYAMARRSGFDEVEISTEMSNRQPEDQWLFRADWQIHDYQSRLRKAV